MVSWHAFTRAWADCMQALPCLLLAFIAKPGTHHKLIFRVGALLSYLHISPESNKVILITTALQWLAWSYLFMRWPVWLDVRQALLLQHLQLCMTFCSYIAMHSCDLTGNCPQNLLLTDVFAVSFKCNLWLHDNLHTICIPMYTFTRDHCPCIWIFIACYASSETSPDRAAQLSNWGMTLQIMWASCVYIEALSVLPQLRMMQKAKVVEKFTAHYVFALGISRFISCAHWILQIIDGDSFLLQAIGSGIWPAMVLLSEVVQTGILADFWWVTSSKAWAHLFNDANHQMYSLAKHLQHQPCALLCNVVRSHAGLPNLRTAHSRLTRH